MGLAFLAKYEGRHQEILPLYQLSYSFNLYTTEYFRPAECLPGPTTS